MNALPSRTHDPGTAVVDVQSTPFIASASERSYTVGALEKPEMFIKTTKCMIPFVDELVW